MLSTPHCLSSLVGSTTMESSSSSSSSTSSLGLSPPCLTRASFLSPSTHPRTNGGREGAAVASSNAVNITLRRHQGEEEDALQLLPLLLRRLRPTILIVLPFPPVAISGFCSANGTSGVGRTTEEEEEEEGV